MYASSYLIVIILVQYHSVFLFFYNSFCIIFFSGKAAEDTITLGDLGVGPNGTIQLEMQSADPVNVPIKPFRPRQEYHMPDVITVRVQSGTNV